MYKNVLHTKKYLQVCMKIIFCCYKDTLGFIIDIDQKPFYTFCKKINVIFSFLVICLIKVIHNVLFFVKTLPLSIINILSEIYEGVKERYVREKTHYLNT